LTSSATLANFSLARKNINRKLNRINKKKSPYQLQHIHRRVYLKNKNI